MEITFLLKREKTSQVENMLSKEHEEFLRYVKQYAQNNPEVAPYIVQAASAGVEETLKITRHRAADFESALAVSLQITDKRQKKDSEFIKQKIEKWRGESALNWEWFLKKMNL